MKINKLIIAILALGAGLYVQHAEAFFKQIKEEIRQEKEQRQRLAQEEEIELADEYANTEESNSDEEEYPRRHPEGWEEKVGIR